MYIQLQKQNPHRRGSEGKKVNKPYQQKSTFENSYMYKTIPSNYRSNPLNPTSDLLSHQMAVNQVVVSRGGKGECTLSRFPPFAILNRCALGEQSI